MKKLIIVVVLAGGGFAAYRLAFAESPAYQAYEKFADAMLHDRWDEARDVAAGESVTRLIDYAKAEPGFLGHECYRLLRGVIHMGPTRKVESETESADGKEVTLRVIQEERRGSPTMAPFGPPTVRHKQDAVVVSTPDGWRVKEFKEEVESIGDR
jgi:hypothetical protein